MDTTGKVATERRGVRPSVTIAVIASILAALLLVLSLTLLFRRDTEVGPQSDTSRFILPPRSIDATDILGRPRSTIRTLLGQPTLSEETLDSFDIGIPLDVRFEHDLAAGLSLTAPGISRHERQVRRWLHLPAEGAIRIGGRPYRVAYFVGDDNRLALNLDENESVATPTAKVAAAPMPVPSAEQLLRSFPNLPPRLKSSCRSVAQGKALACSGFNAKVSVELDGKGDAAALTVIDPPGRGSEAECRAAIEQLVSGVQAAPAGSRHYSSDKLDALYVFAPTAGGNKQSGCSLMVCRKAAELGGARSPCGG